MCKTSYTKAEQTPQQRSHGSQEKFPLKQDPVNGEHKHAQILKTGKWNMALTTQNEKAKHLHISKL